VYNYSLKK